MTRLQFLLLEDTLSDAERVQATLTDGGIDCELVRVDTRADFVTALKTNSFDLILAAYAMPGLDGITALEIAHRLCLGTPFIFVSASLGEELAIEALKQGATDCVLKQRLERLVPCVQRALRETQERRSLKKVEQERERFLAVSSDLQLIIDFDHQIQWVSPSFERLLGWPAREMIGQAWFNFAHPDNIDGFQQAGDARISDNEPFAFENRYRHRDGSYRWFLWNVQQYSEERVVYVVAVDITNRKRVELNAEFLANVSQALVKATRIDEIVQTVGASLNRYLQVSVCAFVEINDRADKAMVNYDWHQDTSPSLVGVYSLSELVRDEIRQTAQAGRPIVIRNHTTDQHVTNPSRYAPLNIGAEINIPLIRDGEWKFSLTVFHSTPYDWREDEIALMQELANRVWTKLEIIRADAALRESEARLRFMLDASQIGDWDLDLTTEPHTAHRSLRHDQIFGYETLLPEWNYEIFLKHIHPDDRAAVNEKFQQTFSASTNWNFECRIIHPDQSVHWIWVRSSVYCDSSDTPTRLLGIVVDITDRKAIEDALRQGEARFRLVVESAKEYAIFTLDLNGIVTSWNAGAERLLGYQEAEILGCDGRIIFTPEDNEQGRADWEMQTALTQGRAENERWHVRKDSNRFWGSGLIMPLQTEAGTTQGFVKIMQDKTEQRQADERFQLLYDTTSELLATEQPLTLMLNLFSKLSAQLELDYYYNYMVEEKDNRPMLHLKNYVGLADAAAEAIEWIKFGQHLCGLVAQRRQQIVLDQAQLSNHPNAQLIYSMGVTAYAGQPLIVQGRLLGTLSFASLTRTRFTPEEIDLLQSTCDQMAIALERSNLMKSIQQQAEQLQRANQIKDEFLAVLSHELRSPLNPILGWTRLLQNGNLDAARQAEALATIERNARLQTQLIEDLLDISRIMQGKLSLTAAPVSLTFVISAAVETVRLAAEARNIQITLDLDNTTSPILGDAARLQQVVWNLLTNAVKFTPNGGQVTVELRTVGLRQFDQLAQVRVIDTGKGITPHFLPHVFEYFRQEDGSTTRKFGGLGLGLAIVRQIVEMHGGTVKAESQGENQGTTFTVQLPVMQQATPAPVELTYTQTDTEALLDNVQILLVDDETDTREFQAFLLKQSGANVTAVASGLEALQALEQFIPNVLVSDVGMAEMDGYMLIQQIRLRPAEQGGMIPAIALTAYAADIDQQKALQVGFQAHLTKPVEPEVLVSAIVSLLQNHSLLQSNRASPR